MSSKGPSKKVTFPYRPNGPGQEAFADAVASGAKVILAMGGVRSGKTYWACVEALKQIYVYNKLPTLGWLVARTYPMSMGLERTWKQLCLLPDGTNLIATERKSERAFLMKPCKKFPNNYYRVEVKTADDPKYLRGISIAWAVMDEGALMARDAFHELKARVLDSGGIIIIATTPLGHNWLVTDIIQKSYTNTDYAVVKMPTAQNSYLSQEGIEALRKQYASISDARARQDLDGEIVDFEGKVFTAFDPGSHIVKSPVISDTTPVYCGIDWGFNDPFVCVFCAQIDGIWYVLDEYYKTRGSLGEHASYLKNHPLWPQVKKIWCDPSGAQQRREFMTMGITCLPARRPKDMHRVGWPESRARLLNRLFASRAELDTIPKTTRPGLVYTDQIRFGLKETLGLSFERFTSVVEDQTNGDINIAVVDREGTIFERNAREKIRDKDNHFVDALGYCLFSEVRTFGSLLAHYEGDGGKEVRQDAKEAEKHPEDAVRLELEDRARAADEKKASDGDEKSSGFDTLSHY